MGDTKMGSGRISEKELLAFLKQTNIVKSGGKEKKDDGKGQKSVESPQSILINPYHRIGMRGSKRVLETNKSTAYRVLRHIAEKAWIINTIIKHKIEGIIPFLDVTKDELNRGFMIEPKDEKTKGNPARIKELEKFFLTTGFEDDDDREDRLTAFVAKFIRDLETLDQVTTEIQYTRGGKVYAFWYIDPATILRCDESDAELKKDKIRFMQEVDSIPTAYYTKEQMIFDYKNPRSDINFAGYGYSNTEQAVELITSQIHSFVYNSSRFTHDNLPRGLLLLQGDAGIDEVEQIEDYLINAMSGNPANKWHVPIIPSGSEKSGDNSRKFDWVPLDVSNRDMEFTQWTETLWTSIAAQFSIDLEELGIKTSKSTSVLPMNLDPKKEISRSNWLSSILCFLEQYLQKILDKIDPDYKIKFYGYEKMDQKQLNEILKGKVETYMTIDEVRETQGLAKFNEDWSCIPLNPQVTQLKSQSQMMGGGVPEGGDFEDAELDEDEGDFGTPNEQEDENQDDQQQEDETGDFGKSLDDDSLSIVL